MDFDFLPIYCCGCEKKIDWDEGATVFPEGWYCLKCDKEERFYSEEEILKYTKLYPQRNRLIKYEQ
jgi:hypothetical protein